jgi:hypothetical protein
MSAITRISDMAKKTVTVVTYVVCNGSGQEVTEPTRNFTEAKAELLRLREEHPAEFHHLEKRSAEVDQ